MNFPTIETINNVQYAVCKSNHATQFGAGYDANLEGPMTFFQFLLSGSFWLVIGLAIAFAILEVALFYYDYRCSLELSNNPKDQAIY